jgi:DNA-binding CsgD family transcriptional regulator
MNQASPSAVVASLTAEEWAYVVRSLDLSPQQANVVRLMLDGHQDKEIAVTLDLTVPTVRTYLARTYDRAQVKGRVQLTVRVFSLAREYLLSSK